MSKLRRKEIQDASTSQEISLPKASRSRPVAASSGLHPDVPSPARDLMAKLNSELTADNSVDAIGEVGLGYDLDQKYPLKWTILGLGLFCGLCWYGLISLVI